MRKPEENQETTDLIREQVRDDLKRAKLSLTLEQFEALLIGVSDEGEIAVYPCRFILPFHYPATIEELDEYGPDHFQFPQEQWELKWKEIPEFAQQYDHWFSIDDDAISYQLGERNLQTRIRRFQEACSVLDPTLTIFGIESDTETWWEVNTFHISGPRIPPPPLPQSDAQLLARLCRHSHSYVGESRFTIEDAEITEASFNGADTTDRTIDLLRGVPNLSVLLRGLRKISLENTLVTSRSLQFLKRELPHVEVIYSHFLEQQ